MVGKLRTTPLINSPKWCSTSKLLALYNLPGMVRIPVIMGRTDVHEGCVMAQSQHSQAQSVQNINHTGNAGKFTESHHTLSCKSIMVAAFLNQTSQSVKPSIYT